MDILQITKDFDNYVNTDLNNALGENWSYSVEVDKYDNNIDIILIDSNEASVISAYALDQSKESQRIIADIENQIGGYLVNKVSNMDPDSLQITYEYDSVKISFRLL